MSVHRAGQNDTPTPSTGSNSSQNAQENTDPDLKRAKDLMDLHYGVKVKQMEGGLDDGLRQARKNVDEVLSSLKKDRPIG